MKRSFKTALSFAFVVFFCSAAFQAEFANADGSFWGGFADGFERARERRQRRELEQKRLSEQRQQRETNERLRERELELREKELEIERLKLELLQKQQRNSSTQTERAPKNEGDPKKLAPTSSFDIAPTKKPKVNKSTWPNVKKETKDNTRASYNLNDETNAVIALGAIAENRMHARKNGWQLNSLRANQIEADVLSINANSGSVALVCFDGRRFVSLRYREKTISKAVDYAAFLTASEASIEAKFGVSYANQKVQRLERQGSTIAIAIEARNISYPFLAAADTEITLIAKNSYGSHITEVVVVPAETGELVRRYYENCK